MRHTPAGGALSVCAVVSPHFILRLYVRERGVCTYLSDVDVAMFGRGHAAERSPRPAEGLPLPRFESLCGREGGVCCRMLEGYRTCPRGFRVRVFQTARSLPIPHGADGDCCDEVEEVKRPASGHTDGASSHALASVLSEHSHSARQRETETQGAERKRGCVNNFQFQTPLQFRQESDTPSTHSS